MADFQTCYFCGAGPGDAIEEVGVVPAAFDPTPDEQQSVALCPDCRDKLTAVLEATVEASPAGAPNEPTGATEGAGGATEEASLAGDREPTAEEPAGTDTDATGDTAGTAGVEPDDGVDDGIDRIDAGTAADESASGGDVADASPGGDAPGAGADAASGASAEASGDDDEGRSAAGTAADRETGPDSLADAVAADRGHGPDDPVEEPTPVEDYDDDPDIARQQGSGVSFNTATAGDEDVLGDDDPDDEVPQRPTGAASVGQGGDDDRMDRSSAAYRQVIRLLQNREFPVDRDEIEAVAASAYDLSPAETASAVDAIVRKGLLVEENGVLRRNRSE